MISSYFVHVGPMGDVLPCAWDSEPQLPRGSRVICRTPRGLEIGRIAGPILSGQNSTGPDCAPPNDAPPDYDPSGQHNLRIVRPFTSEDALLDQRLERHKRRAVQDCQAEIARRELSVVLLDVEHLFDGRTLIFHFLGEVDEALQEVVDELANVYEQRARLKQFAKLLAEGCGPTCGIGEGGCGSSGGCAVCVAKVALRSAESRET
jgi:hypothetical protein